MKKKNHTPEQIITKLRKVEALTAEGTTVAEAVKQIEVSDQRSPRRIVQGVCTNSRKTTRVPATA